jgi:isopenicillin-N epimerase
MSGGAVVRARQLGRLTVHGEKTRKACRRMMNSLKRLFMLDPDVVFLNHGSFGACPRPVFKAYQDWQRQLERQPVKFIQVDLPGFELASRQSLGKYLHTDPNNLAFVTNATYGVNIVSRSLALGPGDEILTTDQEYGACNNAWNFACRKTGAIYIHRPVRLPACSIEKVADEFWQGVTPRTKVIYLSHITSPTALCLPVEEICRRARASGILTLIDGAHAPGQIPLDLETIGADFYTGNCHKWMLCPKGCGFLYARPEVQHMIQPLIVSRAYEPENAALGSHPMLDYFAWTGTRDPSAFLTIPTAIDFMEKHHWSKVREQCHALLRQALERICSLTGLPPAYPPDSEFYVQMAIAPLTPVKDPTILNKRLLEEFHIVMPIIPWQDRLFARISVQGYVTQFDIDTLIKALETLLTELAK